LIGCFEGIDPERGIAWRVADSLALRSFVGLGVEVTAPDHSTISRARRPIDIEMQVKARSMPAISAPVSRSTACSALS
jgi:Transposase domain (DUF772)